MILRNTTLDLPPDITPDNLIVKTVTPRNRGKLLILPVWQDEKIEADTPYRAVRACAEAGGFEAEEGKEYTHKEGDRTIIILGMGKCLNNSTPTCPQNVRAGAKRAAEYMQHARLISATIVPSFESGRDCIMQAAIGARLGLYNFSHALRGRKPWHVKEVRISFCGAEHEDHKAQLRLGKHLADAMNQTRIWSDQPCNLLHGRHLIAEARRIAAKHRDITITVIPYDELMKMGAGLITAVGSGADPRDTALVILEYKPKHTRGPSVLLDGKGLCDDQGGNNSAKSAAGTFGMQYDMCGSATVLSTIDLIATRKLERHVIGVLAISENLIDGKSYRVGDVLKSLSKLRVQNKHSDAEGRLCVADGLTYGLEQFLPKIAITVCTLTGAAMVALGDRRAALMTKDGKLEKVMLHCARVTGELMSPLPLAEELRYQLIPPDGQADLYNVGSGWGGAITAGLFLHEFVDHHNDAVGPNNATSSMHLDIAGPATMGRSGATGYGVMTLWQFLSTYGM